MTVTVGQVYCDITIDPATTELVFPDDAKGPIKPGSLDHLKQLCVIVWGKNMTDLISPGTIPGGIWLVLHSTYKHSLDESKLESCVKVSMHASNYEYAPTDRCFRLWGESTSEFPENMVRCEDTHRHSRIPTLICDIEKCEFFLNTPIIKSPKTAYADQVTVGAILNDPETQNDANEGAKQHRINQSFFDLCLTSDSDAVKAYLEVNQIYILISYRHNACLKMFIKARDLDMCKLFHDKLGPIDPIYLQTQIKQASMGDLVFCLDLAEVLGITPITSERKYRTILHQVCGSGSGLELAKRVYNLWPTPNPFVAVAGSCLSWDTEVFDYFLELINPSTRFCGLTDRATIMISAVGSGNVNALHRIVTCTSLNWVALSEIINTDTDENAFTNMIKSAASQKTTAMIDALIQEISDSSSFFTFNNLNRQAARLQTRPGLFTFDYKHKPVPKQTGTFWSQYANAVELLCRNNHINAIKFFVQVMQPTPDQIMRFINSASSDEAVKAIMDSIGPVMTPNTALDLAKACTSVTARKHLIAHYKSLADQLD